MRELPDAALLYGPPGGQTRLRRAITSYLGRVRAIIANEQETLITCGSTHAFTLLCMALRAAGVRRVAHEDPAWERIPSTIAQAGLEPVPVRVDARGLSVADLCRADAQAVIVSPAHQYPSGVIMHPERRGQLIAWARDTGGLVVEDDYDAEYRFGQRPMAPLRSSARDCVAYVGTTSKVLAPALRLGWLIVPPRMASAVAAEHAVAHAQPSVINQQAFATLLDSGDIDRHLRRTRAVYRARRAALLSSVTDHVPLRITGGAAGLHLMAWLSPHTSECEAVAKASSVGIAVDGLHTACAVTRQLRPALVLGYGAISESVIPAAISKLAEVIST
jgi:GntR family transcriptional regulator/MocR family aminotransferase